AYGNPARNACTARGMELLHRARVERRDCSDRSQKRGPMMERKEATDPPKTLLGLGPPELPEPSIVVNLAKAHPKDTSVVTVRAWATSQSEYDALTSASNDDDVLPFAAHPLRRAAAFAALGVFAFVGAFALTSTFRRPTAPHAAKSMTLPRVAALPPK